jgi:hypothetical protein
MPLGETGKDSQEGYAFGGCRSAVCFSASRLERAGVPTVYRTARTKPEMALAEIDCVVAAGVRFGCACGCWLRAERAVPTLTGLRSCQHGCAYRVVGQSLRARSNCYVAVTTLTMVLLPRFVKSLLELKDHECVTHWLDYDPVALVVLIFGIGAVTLLALSI